MLEYITVDLLNYVVVKKSSEFIALIQNNNLVHIKSCATSEDLRQIAAKLDELNGK